MFTSKGCWFPWKNILRCWLGGTSSRSAITIIFPPALLSPYYSFLSLSLSSVFLSHSLTVSLLRFLYFLPGTGILTHFWLFCVFHLYSMTTTLTTYFLFYPFTLCNQILSKQNTIFWKVQNCGQKFFNT